MQIEPITIKDQLINLYSEAGARSLEDLRSVGDVEEMGLLSVLEVAEQSPSLLHGRMWLKPLQTVQAANFPCAAPTAGVNMVTDCITLGKSRGHGRPPPFLVPCRKAGAASDPHVRNSQHMNSRQVLR